MSATRRWLRRLGITALVVGGLTIDGALLLLLSSIPVDTLTTATLVGIGVVAFGLLLLVLAPRSADLQLGNESSSTANSRRE